MAAPHSCGGCNPVPANGRGRSCARATDSGFDFCIPAVRHCAPPRSFMVVARAGRRNIWGHYRNAGTRAACYSFARRQALCMAFTWNSSYRGNDEPHTGCTHGTASAGGNRGQDKQCPQNLAPPRPSLRKKKPKRINSIAPSRTVVLKPANMDAGCTRRRATRRTAQRCGAVRANTACTGRSILGLAYIPSVRRTRWLWCTTFIPQDCRP